MDENTLTSLEQKIDRLLALLDKFEPLLERLQSGASLFKPTFKKRS